jgi:hypothetical protein
LLRNVPQAGGRKKAAMPQPFVPAKAGTQSGKGKLYGFASLFPRGNER